MRGIGRLLFGTALVGALLATGAVEAREARLLRFADIHRDKVAFVHAGDIWVAPSTGGEAYRLTSHEGMELFPKFSPDGSRIAFSAEYGGNRQLWVIDVDGGEPRQLTYYNDVGPMPPRGGFDYRVLDWTPDGEHVLFRANRLPWGVRLGRPYLVPVEGGMERPLEVPETGGGMLSPDGRYFVYTPIDREFRTWKRHEGGRAQDVWIYDLEGGSAEQITDHPRTDNQPVWLGDSVYFTSDRDDRLNLYRHDRAGGKSVQVTEHDDFDVLWPSAGPEQIVYESGGYLYRYTPEGGSTRIEITLRGDFPGTIARFAEVRGFIQGGDLSPSGKRAVFAARGDLFTVPAEQGEIRNVTESPGVREHSPVWSPDGRWLAYLSDRSGEYELYLRKQDGSGTERRITTDGDIWRFAPVWSPDGNKLAFGDKKQRLRYVDVESGLISDVDASTRNDITTYVWSPDSRWLAYTKVGDSQFTSIWLFSLVDRSRVRLTDDFTNDYSPAFDPKGRYLYFLSDRDYNLTFSGYEFNYFYTNPTRVYAATLRRDVKPLMEPKSDEEEPLEEDDEAAEAPEKKNRDKKKTNKRKRDVEPIAIEAEGLADRVVALPGAAGNYASVAATATHVLYLRQGQAGSSLDAFSLESEEVETLIENVGAYTLAAGGEKLLYRYGANNFGIVGVKKGKRGDGRLDLGGMTLKIDPRVEWRQIFDDFYRIARDWFYDPELHGLDWPAMRALYEPLVEHVAHRADLDYIFGEMGGELNAGHFYVNWGAMPSVLRRDGGLLGAEIEPHDSGYFRIGKIFPGENWNPAFRSPLTEPNVEAAEGELIVAVNGRPANEVANFYELMENTAGREIKLTLNAQPSLEGARDEVVRPITRETNLRYLDWVQSRRALVDELSDGRVGYIHMPNTAAAGNRELRKWFYPQAHKDALIFDVRYNGGGFIPDRMIELLTRRQLGYWKFRGLEPQQVPGYAHTGPKACLINHYSSSGGDAFPFWFRLTEQGPLLGTRTWGGLIGLSGNPGFVDGGSISVPTFRFMNPGGEWDVENVGVAPDIEVVDRPDLVAAGQDPTLERAVRELLGELADNPPTEVVTPAPIRYPR